MSSRVPGERGSGRIVAGPDGCATRTSGNASSSPVAAKFVAYGVGAGKGRG
ncbi:hypothetical protein [Streptomyces yanii]|uniref:Uncharacterized protein n=1 Tax=Streptomyces yanii TaxID=78510 RepID=A0ABV5R943_9ACTN